MWGLKIQIKNNSYPVEVYRIMINEARHHLDVRLKPKSDYIQIRQGETKTILPGELCRQQIYTFDASIRIYLITPFEEAYEIRYINTDRLNYYQSEPVPILYSKEDHESSKVQTTQVRQYSIHGGIKGTIKDNFPEVARDLEDQFKHENKVSTGSNLYPIETFRLFTSIQKLLYCYRYTNPRDSHKNTTSSSLPNQSGMQNLCISHYHAHEKRR